MPTILIKNGIIVDSGTMTSRDILVENEKIVALGERGTLPHADQEIDATHCFVLPGLIDAHVHPVYADRIKTLSQAALGGGITTIIPYIGAVVAWGQNSSLVEAISGFMEEAEHDSCIDFAVHCTLTRNVLDEAETAIPALIEKGVISFKGFTSYRKRGMKLEDEDILRIMNLVATEGGLLAFHAENGALLDYLEERSEALGLVHPRWYPATHPPVSEAEAVFRVLSLATASRCPLYLPHLTCQRSLDVVSLFRSWGDGLTVYTETCPHYLTFTDALLEERGNLAKMSPPLRKESDCQALWQALASHSIDVIASDAAGHTRKANEPLFDKTFAAPHGAPGVDTLFPVIWSQGVNTGRISIPDVARLLSENPAKIFGLYPRKGALQSGSDADIVLVEAGSVFCVPDSNPLVHVDYSLFSGLRGMGRQSLVMQRGRVVYKDGEILADPGQGHFIPGERRGEVLLA